MKNQKHYFAIFLAILIALSFAALIQLQISATHSFSEKNAVISQINEMIDSLKTLYPTQYNNTIYSQNSSQINLTRANIHTFITKNPGTEFRGICTGLGLAIGTVQFHIQVLEKRGAILSVRDGKYKRFFASKTFSEKEMKLISLLRHQTIKKILKIIENDGNVNHSVLASDLKITSQGLIWQMRRLKNEGIIDVYSDGSRTSYAINITYKQILPQLLNERVP